VRTSSSGALDPGGKQVDLYPPQKFLRTFVFNDSEHVSVRLFELTLDALLEVASSNQKRVRERNLPVWSGRTRNRLGAKLFIVGVPYGLHHPAFQVFARRYGEDPSFVEINYSRPEEFQGTPFVRYDFGRLIWYGDPFARAENITPPQRPTIAFEIRSCKQDQSYRKGQRAASKPELPNRSCPRLHSLDVWQENRKAILEFVYGLKGPCTYKTLSSIVQKHFGIDVFEEESSQFVQYGLIRLGRIWVSQGPTVRVLIRADLDNRLKYVVLCHELAHYVLHFPLLLLSETVEEASWEIPEIEELFCEALARDQMFANAIETEADDLAVHLLIPPSAHPLGRLTPVILEGGQSPTPKELAWRFLQPQFPEDEFGNPLWRDLTEIKKQASRDTLRVSATPPANLSSLFERMLQAALRVDDSAAKDRPGQMGIDKVLQQVGTVLSDAQEMPMREAREYVRQRLIGSSGVEDTEARNFLAEGWTFCREIIPPLEWDGQSSYPRVPLTPAPHNPEGDADDDWYVTKQGSLSPAGTVSEWRGWKKDHGLVLYRLEAWQKRLLKR
jgi:hypothetical protein